jgi:hypothetical protein
MVPWTTPFMIGITDVSLNSDDVLFQPLTGFTSSFPNQPLARMKGFEPLTHSFGDYCSTN